MSSKPGGIVFDPFCGCATACSAAQRLGRHWVGIDVSSKAADLVQSRIRDELNLLYKGAHWKDIPQRTDSGKVLPYNSPENKKYLYGETERLLSRLSKTF